MTMKPQDESRRFLPSSKIIDLQAVPAQKNMLLPLISILKRKLKMQDAALFFHPRLLFSFRPQCIAELKKSCYLISDITRSSCTSQLPFSGGSLAVIPVIDTLAMGTAYTLLLHQQDAREFTEEDCILVHEFQDVLSAMETSKAVWEVQALLDTYLITFAAVTPLAPMLSHLSHLPTHYAQVDGWDNFQHQVMQLQSLVKSIGQVCSFYTLSMQASYNNAILTYGRESFIQVPGSILNSIQLTTDMWLDLHRVSSSKVIVRNVNVKSLIGHKSHRVHHHHLMFFLHTLLSMWLVPCMSFCIYVDFLPGSVGHVKIWVEISCANVTSMMKRIAVTKHVCKICNEFLCSQYILGAGADFKLEGDKVICQIRMPCQMGSDAVDGYDAGMQLSLAGTMSTISFRPLSNASGSIYNTSSSTYRLYPGGDFHAGVSNENISAENNGVSSFELEASALRPPVVTDNVSISASKVQVKRSNWCGRMFSVFSFY